jgi:hypothetical protein
VGLRKLLTRQPAEDPLERLAERGREPDSAVTPSAAFADRATRDDAAPIYGAPTDKTAGSFFVAKSKKAVGPLGRRSGYVWISERSRSKRASWADFTDQTL